jgi:hypothetical protein
MFPRRKESVVNNSNNKEEKLTRQLSCPQEEVDQQEEQHLRLVATEQIPVN